MTFNVYREQLTSLYHGIALWNPNPVQHLYDCGHVSIGDVGYLCDGGFVRMFNVTLPWNDPSNTKLGIPMEFKSLEVGALVDVHEFPQIEYYSRHVSKVENQVENTWGFQLETPDDAIGQKYRCWGRCRGAFLSLPHGGRREDIIRTKVIEGYVRGNADSWFDWSKKRRLPVERMEDLILVTGCTLVTSWAAAVFDHSVFASSISLHAQTFAHGGAQFFWSNNGGNVEYRNSQWGSDDEQPRPQNQCVFIRGFRAKRRPFFGIKHLRAKAEPLPDDSDNHRDEIHRARVPAAPKYRDPLIAFLDYIVEISFKCVEYAVAEDIIAIAHVDNLQLIEDVETLPAGSIERFLYEKQMPLLIENGAAILCDPCDHEPPVPDEKKATFYAAAELNGESVPFVIPASSASPTLYPPMLSLNLEDYRGYPQTINVAVSDLRGAATLQDVLREIQALRTPFSKREFEKLRR